ALGVDGEQFGYQRMQLYMQRFDLPEIGVRAVKRLAFAVEPSPEAAVAVVQRRRHRLLPLEAFFDAPNPGAQLHAGKQQRQVGTVGRMLLDPGLRRSPTVDPASDPVRRHWPGDAVALGQFA